MSLPHNRFSTGPSGDERAHRLYESAIKSDYKETINPLEATHFLIKVSSDNLGSFFCWHVIGDKSDDPY